MERTKKKFTRTKKADKPTFTRTKKKSGFVRTKKKEVPPIQIRIKGEMTEDSPMPTGMFKGERVGDMWPEYLYRIYNDGMCTPKLKRYIETRMKDIEEQIQENKNNHNREMRKLRGGKK